MCLLNFVLNDDELVFTEGFNNSFFCFKKYFASCTYFIWPDYVGEKVLFDGAGCIKRYANVEEILREFYALRMEYYLKRKEYLEGMLTAESLKLNNQARFICEKIENIISIGLYLCIYDFVIFKWPLLCLI